MTSEQPTILCENSVGIQRLTDENGVTKNVHVVAKTLPFVMEVSFPLPLLQCKLEAVLFYDGPILSNLREVPNTIGDIMVYNVFINETGSRATVECKINALTSQHRSQFRVRVQASLLSDPELKMAIFSSPILTVSKHSQATKQLQKKKPTAVSPPKLTKNNLATNTNALEPILNTATSSPPSSSLDPTPSHGDPVLKALQRMEKRQLEQQKQLDHLLRANGCQFEPIVIPDPEEIDFEEAFQKLVQSYNLLPQTERFHKIRKLSSSNSFGAFIEICTSALLISAPESTLHPDVVRDTSTDREIFYSEMENMYPEIFSSPDASPQIL